MKALTALFTALALLLGVVACSPTTAPAPVNTPASVELVAPASPAPAPVTAPITAPDVQLTAQRVEVQTAPAPALEVPSAPTVSYSHPPLTLEFVTAYPVFYSASATCPVGLAMAEDNTCLPLHYWDNPVPECMEDMPCWDCSTMGNLICGSSVAPEVTACPANWYLFSDGVCIDPSTVQPTTAPVEDTVAPEVEVTVETAPEVQETLTVEGSAIEDSVRG